MDTELILSIGQKLYREEKLTANGLFYLTREPNCSYMAIVIQITHLYEEYVIKNNLDTRALERIRTVASHYVDILPDYVRSLSDKHLKEYQREVADAFRREQG
jgi:hypothetical protein